MIAHIVVKGTITVTDPDNVKRNKAVTFKNNAPFINCISKLNGVQIDNAGDLDVVKPLYNLTEYSKNYRKTTLKLLSNFWRVSNIPLINCEIELILTWSKKFVLVDVTTRDAGNNDDPPAIVAHTGLGFQITDTKLYVPVVTLSKENDTKRLEQLKTGFKRAIKWNKYRSQMTIQPQNNKLNCLIDPTFTNVNRLFVLSFTRNNAGDNRDSFSHYYVPNAEMKSFNVLINGKRFFDLPVKNEEEN